MTKIVTYFLHNTNIGAFSAGTPRALGIGMNTKTTVAIVVWNIALALVATTAHCEEVAQAPTLKGRTVYAPTLRHVTTERVARGARQVTGRGAVALENGRGSVRRFAVDSNGNEIK